MSQKMPSVPDIKLIRTDFCLFSLPRWFYSNQSRWSVIIHTSSPSSLATGALLITGMWLDLITLHCLVAWSSYDVTLKKNNHVFEDMYRLCGSRKETLIQRKIGFGSPTSVFQISYDFTLQLLSLRQSQRSSEMSIKHTDGFYCIETEKCFASLHTFGLLYWIEIYIDDPFDDILGGGFD